MISKKFKVLTSIILTLIIFVPVGIFLAEASLQTDYVKVIVSTGSGPTAVIECRPQGCGLGAGLCEGYTKSFFCLKNNSDDPDGLGDIQNSVWTIYETAGGSQVDSSDCMAVSGDPLCNWTLPSTFLAGNYRAELLVTDMANNTDMTQTIFDVWQDIVADFECSLDPNPAQWESCEGFGLAEGEIIYFRDESTPSQFAAQVVRRDWTFEDGNPSQNIGNNAVSASSTFSLVDAESGKVTLVVEDNAVPSRTATTTYNLTVRKKVPEWKEVSP